MSYYKREDFKVCIETDYNKYSKDYLHSLVISRKLDDDTYKRIWLNSSSIVSTDLNYVIEELEKFKNNFIVASSIEINLNSHLTGENYDTVWLVDLDKNIVKCLNGVTGAEGYHINTILDFNGNTLVPCSGTAGRWNRLEINYPEFREQLERILNENNYDYNVAQQERIVIETQDDLKLKEILENNYV